MSAILRYFPKDIQYLQLYSLAHYCPYNYYTFAQFAICQLAPVPLCVPNLAQILQIDLYINKRSVVISAGMWKLMQLHCGTLSLYGILSLSLCFFQRFLLLLSLKFNTYFSCVRDVFFIFSFNNLLLLRALCICVSHNFFLLCLCNAHFI